MTAFPLYDPEAVLFAGATIDRAAHLRDRADDLAAAPAARAAVFWRGKALFEGSEAPRLAWLPLTAPLLAEAAEPPIFLGLDDAAPRFAYDISAWDDPAADTQAMGSFVDTSTNRHPAMTEAQAFLDLRATMSRLNPADAGNAAAAKGIFGWHDTHRFCARCGAPSNVSMAGWRRTCPACGAHHFPRTDPVVIMLITHGDRLLLGRSPGWPEGMYSLLAGFMEPGESVEAAVRREVAEEAGIAVGSVRYLSSQPWPFPASLMIGCWGVAETDAITLDPVELEDAVWLTRAQLIAERTSPNPRLRPARRGAIAQFLIEHWLADRLGPAPLAR
ncbi:MAG: NAD(+) diphosphatase [Pseudomonadota bacterium]